MESTLYHTAHSTQYDILRVSSTRTLPGHTHHACVSTSTWHVLRLNNNGAISHDCDIVFSTDFRKVSSDCTRLGAASSKAPTLPLLSRHTWVKGGVERGRHGCMGHGSRPGVGGARLGWVRLGVYDNGHAPVADERQHEGRARDVHDRHGLWAQERRGASSARHRVCACRIARPRQGHRNTE